MPDLPITGLPADAAPLATDVTVVVDLAAGVTKQSTLGQVFTADAQRPTAGEKAALAGTSGVVGAGNPYVTDADARNSNARTPTAHHTSHEPGGGDALAVDALAATGSLRTLSTTGTSACAGNDARLSDARTPTAHATSHKSGGSDAIKLDELAAPTDVTTLNVSSTLHGLTPKSPADATQFLNGAATPAFTTLAGAIAGKATTVVTNTDTGTQNDWAPTLTDFTVIEWSGASDATITGIAGRASGKIVVVKNTGTKIAYFAHAGAGSAAGNRLNNIVTSGSTPVAPGGCIAYAGDSTDWKLIGHEQGSWIAVPFDAANFTGNGSMTWTVDAGDVGQYSYYLTGAALCLSWYIFNTTVGGTPSGELRLTLPNGFAGSSSFPALQLILYNDNAGGNTQGYAQNPCGPGFNTPTKVAFSKNAGGAWSAATNATNVFGTLMLILT